MSKSYEQPRSGGAMGLLPSAMLAVFIIAFAAQACSYDFDAAFGPAIAPGDAASDVVQDTSTTDADAQPPEDAEAGSDVTSESSDGLLVENCLNGEDDDDDGLVDCADPDCEPGFTCVPMVDVGWTGVSSVSDPEGTAPSCEPGQVMTMLQAGLNAPGVSCECGCGAPTAGSCIVANMKAFSGPGCIVLGEDIPPGCNSINVSLYPFVRGEIALAPGACTPSAQPSAEEPPSWTESIVVCDDDATGAGCGANSICVARPPSGFQPETCVHAPGDLACPKGYPTRTVYSEGLIIDGRSCTTEGCTCDVPIESCATNVGLFSDDNCNTPTGNVQLDDNCNQLPLQTDSIFRPTAPYASNVTAGCEPKGSGTVEGSVTNGAPHTVCCTGP